MHLKNTSPSADGARSTTDRPQSWCCRGAPTAGRPTAAICSTIHVDARANQPGRDHAGRNGDHPSARSRAHEATAARDVSGSSRAIACASRSSQVQPGGGAAPTASHSTSSVTSPRSAAADDVMTVRRTTVVSLSRTSAAASISGTRGSASDSETVGNQGAVGDHDRRALGMRHQETDLTALRRPGFRHVSAG